MGNPETWSWLTSILKMNVRPVRALKRMPNKEAILIANRDEVGTLNDALQREGKAPVDEDVFRANLYVSSKTENCSDMKGTFRNDAGIQITSTMECTRCGVVNVDPKTGNREKAQPIFPSLQDAFWKLKRNQKTESSTTYAHPLVRWRSNRTEARRQRASPQTNLRAAYPKRKSRFWRTFPSESRRCDIYWRFVSSQAKVGENVVPKGMCVGGRHSSSTLQEDE